MKWYEETASKVMEELSADAAQGHKTETAKRLLSVYGRNVITEKKRPGIIKRFLGQLNDFMIIVLISAAGVSFLVSILQGEADFTDPIIILMIVILNAILGVLQESKAQKAIDSLKKLSQPMARVLRDGHISHINTEELVPGDILVLEAGDYVTADARLIGAFNLKAEESTLTGESEPVQKDEKIKVSGGAALGDMKNMVFSGSSIVFGRGKAVVCATGMNTEIGKIAAMIMVDNAPETPLQKKLSITGKILGIGALVICVIIFFMGLHREIPAFDMFMTSISLAVAAIPEGLPAIVTVMLAIGVTRMAGKNAIIRKLPAVETLGSATVICSDKTGTLTQNKMNVVHVSDGFRKFDYISDSYKRLLMFGMLCGDCYIDEGIVLGDPTEVAIYNAGIKAGNGVDLISRRYPRVGEIPFDSNRKLMTTLHKGGEKGFISITKGAAEEVLRKCINYLEDGQKRILNDNKRRAILEHTSQMADKALRVLAIAYNDHSSMVECESDLLEQGLTFCGLVGMIDPPREEAAEAVKTCIKAGIKPVMITGDHVRTAVAIAKEIGITRDGKTTSALTGAELNNMDKEELIQNIQNYSVFARVTPEHKVRIVKAFQARGEVVAMTGDGVNDAPALKGADIGCAMGIAGTDVAKGAADMILTDDNFATIVDAVKEGRGIYLNIRKAVHFLLSSNIGEILVIFAAMLAGWSSPLLPIHLLWVNLVTDSLPAIALGMDPVDSNIMSRPPVNAGGGLFSGQRWIRIVSQGIMVGMLSLLAFAIGHIFFDDQNSFVIGRTMAFATISIAELVHAFNMRTEKSLFSIDILSNRYLVGAFLLGVGLQVAVITMAPLAGIFKVAALSPVCWLIVIFLCIIPVGVVELEKLLIRNSVGAKKSVRA